MDPAQNIDGFVTAKRITIGNSINIALILGGGNPDASIRVIVNPTILNSTSALTVVQLCDAVISDQ